MSLAPSGYSSCSQPVEGNLVGLAGAQAHAEVNIIEVFGWRAPWDYKPFNGFMD